MAEDNKIIRRRTVRIPEPSSFVDEKERSYLQQLVRVLRNNFADIEYALSNISAGSGIIGLENIDGGNSLSIYFTMQTIEGGDADDVYGEGQFIDEGGA